MCTNIRAMVSLEAHVDGAVGRDDRPVVSGKGVSAKASQALAALVRTVVDL